MADFGQRTREADPYTDPEWRIWVKGILGIWRALRRRATTPKPVRTVTGSVRVTRGEYERIREEQKWR